MERVGDHQFRLGQVLVDTEAREVSVPAHINDVTVLEFIACTRSGFKAYESAVTADTNAVTFNAALLLIGLDRSHATAPRGHFDPSPAVGDPVEVWIEPLQPAGPRFRAEQLAFDRVTNKTMPEGSWAYTGSTFVRSVGGQNYYLAESDGVLIGFVHDPATIIESTVGTGLGRYGSIVLNRNLGLAPNAPVRLIVKAVGPPTTKHR